MSDNQATSLSQTTPPPATATPALPTKAPATAAKFFAALGSPVRWPMIQLLASGQVLAATHIAAKLGRDFDGVSKHLRILRAAGVICSKRGGDMRCEWYYIPAQCRTEPGVLNYGWCRICL